MSAVGGIFSDWPVRKLVVNPPSLHELVPAIQSGLKANFQDVSVTVEQCPDLRFAPYHLAAVGLSGNTRIGEVGSPQYVDPPKETAKRYDFLHMARLMDMSSDRGIIIGAGAGPNHVLGTNTEYMPNMSYRSIGTMSAPELTNLSTYTQINDDGEVLLKRIDNDITAFDYLTNVFCADGLPGPVLHVKVKTRTGALNFPSSLIQGLKSEFGDRLISIGGVFLIRKGAANLHAMAHTPEQTFKGKIDDPWLRSYDASAPLVGLTVLHSSDDQGAQLRTEHTHCFSVDSDRLVMGGHYHWDTEETKAEVEYEAWLNTAELVYRIDAPSVE